MWAIGVDLGKQRDWTAIAGVELVPVRTKDPNLPDAPRHYRKPRKVIMEHRLRLLERPKQGTPYPEVVDRIETILTSPELMSETVLVVDMNGVGEAVIDIMRQRKLRPVGVKTHGGNTTTRHEYGYNVPKVDIVTALQVLYQTRRIVVADNLKLREAYKKELQAFTMKINDKGHAGFEAAREQDHDDLVMAVSMACWYLDKVHRPIWEEGVEDEIAEKEEYDPLRDGLGARRPTDLPRSV